MALFFGIPALLGIDVLFRTSIFGFLPLRKLIYLLPSINQARMGIGLLGIYASSIFGYIICLILDCIGLFLVYKLYKHQSRAALWYFGAIVGLSLTNYILLVLSGNYWTEVIIHVALIALVVVELRRTRKAGVSSKSEKHEGKKAEVSVHPYIKRLCFWLYIYIAISALWGIVAAVMGNEGNGDGFLTEVFALLVSTGLELFFVSHTSKGKRWALIGLTAVFAFVIVANATTALMMGSVIIPIIPIIVLIFIISGLKYVK
jgi:hypothetical protein